MESFMLPEASNYEITNDDEEVPEVELLKVLDTLRTETLLKFNKHEYKSAIVFLKKSEELLEAMMTQGGSIKHDEVLLTLHNLAFCYQKLGDLPKSAAYLEACVYNANTFNAFGKGNNSDLQVKIKKDLYLAKAHVQLCAVLSELQDHKQAVMHSRKALSYSVAMIKGTLKIAAVFSSNVSKSKKLRTSVPPPSKNALSVITLISPALRSLSNFMKNGKIIEINKIPSVLGVKGTSEWAQKVTLADILLMQSMEIGDLRDSISPQSEFTKDYLIMKICLFGASYFCHSTELQFLRMEKEEAQAYHEKALNLLSGFIPVESPLFTHIKDTYYRRFVPKIEENAKYTEPEQDIVINSGIGERKLPIIRERPASLSPAFKFKKIDRRINERPKTVTNFDSIMKSNNKYKSPKYARIRLLKSKKP